MVFHMRIGSLQLVTWVTIAAAVACALWLALLAPDRPFAAAHQDASVGVVLDVVDASLVDAPPAAGPAGSAPAASQAASF